MRKFAVLAALLLALVGCSTLAAIGDLSKDIEADDYKVTGINHNTMNGHDVLAIQATTLYEGTDAEADAERIAKIAWTKYKAEIDELTIVLNGTPVLNLSADELTGKFGERPAGLTDSGNTGGGTSVSVIIAAVVGAVLVVVLAVVVWLRGRRKPPPSAPPPAHYPPGPYPAPPHPPQYPS